MAMGNQADLARLLGISRSAVNQAIKRHGIQVSVDGRFDLEYMAWLLNEKQDNAKSKAQRSAKKQMAGLKNPALKREVIRLLWPIWDEAIRETIQARAETSFEDELDDIELSSFLYACMGLWSNFHRIIEREYPSDMGDFPFKTPDCIDFDITTTPVLEVVRGIVGASAGNNTADHDDVDYSKMPLDELEALVFSSPDIEIGSE